MVAACLEMRCKHDLDFSFKHQYAVLGGSCMGFALLQRTSAENPLLLIETPVGGAGPGPTWNMEIPIVDVGVKKRLAASCPTTPDTAFLKAARPHTVAQAGRMPSVYAQGDSTQEDANMRRHAKRQLFAQAADLAADLARLRKRIQERLQQLPLCSGDLLNPPEVFSAANSGAVSLASACSREGGSSLAASPYRKATSELDSTVGMLRRNVLLESGETPCGPLQMDEEERDGPSQLSMPQAAALAMNAAPDLASMPPRIQRLAQASDPADAQSGETHATHSACSFH